MEKQYNSLEEIRAEKDKLLQEIRKENNTMAGHWNALFHHQDSSSLLPSKRTSRFLTTGASVFDFAVLGWKLYRKFKKKKRK